MDRLIDRLKREANERALRGRDRAFATPSGVSFTSNDYLGLSRHQAVSTAVRTAIDAGVPHGSTGSRLLSGHHDAHSLAESAFASFVAREASLLFGSGYLANMALLSALPARRDLVMLDAASHASLKEGARAGLATRRSFRHNDVGALARTLRDRGAFESAFIVVEGIYSMDGDAAPLGEIAAIAEQHNAHIIVDEAHATGLFGPNLRGQHELYADVFVPLATVHPCGKALGCAGAFIAADRIVIDAIINAARAFIFSTAPPPLTASALAAAINMLPSMHSAAMRVRELGDRLRSRLRGLSHWRVLPSIGPIVPVVIGGDEETVRVAEALRSLGFDVRAVRPPTVPEGTSRLRFTVTVDRSDHEIDELADAIRTLEEEYDAVDA